MVSEESIAPLANAQYQTAQFFIERLTPETRLYPTHGFGSFCAATDTESVDLSTMAEQLKTNHAYTSKDQKSFVNELISGLDSYPSYYAFMGPANLKGPLEPNLVDPSISTKEAVIHALHDGAAIVDMRSRIAYATQHLPGTYNIELCNTLSTYVGWLIAWDAPLILVANSSEEAKAAQEQLSLIGREIVAGQVRPSDLLLGLNEPSSYPVRRFVDLAAKNDETKVLDVRRKSEWKKGHVKNAAHIPLHELSGSLGEVPDDQQVWVHCGSGFRASIAASILSNANKKPVLIDDSFDETEKAGITIMKE